MNMPTDQSRHAISGARSLGAALLGAALITTGCKDDRPAKPSALSETSDNIGSTYAVGLPQCRGGAAPYGLLKGSWCPIPVVVLVEKDKEGKPYLDEDQVDLEMKFVNEMFLPAGFQFELIERKTFEHLKAEDLVMDDGSGGKRERLCFELTPVHDALGRNHVTLAFTQLWEGHAGALPNACVKPWTTHVLASDPTTTHELGHVLGLLHPHETVLETTHREPADNPYPNCYDVQLGGDGLCDTPPDPSIFDTNRCTVTVDCKASCKGEYADYRPNPKLVMSYALDACRSDPAAAWSQEQINAMHCFFLYSYNEKLCNGPKPCSRNNPRGLCPPGTSCRSGSCASDATPSCTDECADGTYKCVGGEQSFCARNFDDDSCLEWGGAVSCAAGCSGPVCATSTCPNGACDPGEGCASCPQDCPCTGGLVCRADACVAAPGCPDGTCDPGEGCSSCPQDCGCGGGLVCQANSCVPCTPVCSASPSYPTWTDETASYTVRARMHVTGCTSEIEMSKGDGTVFQTPGTMKIFDEGFGLLTSATYLAGQSSVTITVDLAAYLDESPQRYLWVMAETQGGSCPGGAGCYSAGRTAPGGCGGSLCVTKSGCP